MAKELTFKSDEVTIINFNTSAVPQQGVGGVKLSFQFFGLGDDGKIYIYQVDHKKWSLV